MIDIIKVADEADMIVNGYAYTLKDGVFHVLNLNCPNKTAIFDLNMEVLETNMNSVEIEVAKEYLVRNKRFIEEYKEMDSM